MSWDETKKQEEKKLKVICTCGKEIDLNRNMWIHTSRYDDVDDEIRIQCEYCNVKHDF